MDICFLDKKKTGGNFEPIFISPKKEEANLSSFKRLQILNRVIRDSRLTIRYNLRPGSNGFLYNVQAIQWQQLKIHSIQYTLLTV